MAIVLGSSAMCTPGGPAMASDMGFLSEDGRSRSFDARGTGYGRGEGICAVILKKRSLAERDGNDLRAVVRGTASNHIGKNAGRGITVPSTESQEAMIRSVYQNAGIHPDDTQYFEVIKGSPSESLLQLWLTLGRHTVQVPRWAIRLRCGPSAPCLVPRAGRGSSLPGA